MSIFDDITALLRVNQEEQFDVTQGYAATGAALPYVTTRPLLMNPESVALNGDALAYDSQTSAYCAAESVAASFNLALMVMRAVQGKPAGGTTLSASMGYVGALVEGHYETQVTISLNQGGI